LYKTNNNCPHLKSKNIYNRESKSLLWGRIFHLSTKPNVFHETNYLRIGAKSSPLVEGEKVAF